jgi:hypothetical protein
MKLLLSLVLLLAMVSAGSAFSAESPNDAGKTDEALTKKVAEAITELSKVKAGMTRKELLKIVTTEGGLSTRTHRQYVYKKCPYIKIDVEFEAVGEAMDGESSADKIVKVSKPYLEFTIGD